MLVSILSYDQSALVAINSLLVDKSPILDKIIEFLAVYLVYGLPVAMIILWFAFPDKRKALFLSFAGTVIAWLVLTKFVVPAIWFRPRPDLAAIGLKEVLFHRPDYSFPSDHATALFGMAFGLYLFNWRKAANYFLLFAIIICTCRVALGVHFPLDIIGGAVSGLIGALVAKACSKFLIKYLYNPIVSVLKKVRMA